MATLKMTDKKKAIAYVLNKEHDISMDRIAKMFGVSQSTISNAIKDFEYQRTIINLEDRLTAARTSIGNGQTELTYEDVDRILLEIIERS